MGVGFEMIKFLEKEITEQSFEIGGKAKSLVTLVRSNFAVPKGFVITAKMQKEFFERNEIFELVKAEEINLNSNDFGEFSSAAKRIRKAIVSAKFSIDEMNIINGALEKLKSDLPSDSLYAVRSSAGIEDGAVDSWAGQFDSFLEVQEEDIPNYIKLCWASMFGLRAIKYGMKSLLSNHEFPFSVIVQEMINGDYSGIAFSVNPNDSNENHIRIEAVAGTGESAVGGQETPYSVVMGKDDGVIIKRTFGSQGRIELVKPSILKRLMEEVKRIEKTFEIPVDVEWTVRDSNIYILQARPITTNKENSTKGTGNLPDILDYELTFKVSGLGFMFADLLCRGFGYLHPLFICSNSEFLQYFTNERMEYAARYGHRWLSSENGFIEYRKQFTDFHKKNYKKLVKIVNDELNENSVNDFFNLVYEYFVFYSKMDFQFTNLTYLYADENPIIAENLRRIAEFKDIARVWVNFVSIDDDCLLNQLMTKISERFNISSNNLELYKITEIISLFSEKQVKEEVLKERFENSLAYTDGYTIKYAWGKEAEEFVAQVKEVYEAQATADIIGQVANKEDERYVIGKVACINVDYSNLEAMEQNIAQMDVGAILISEFTAPELMAACNKAKAIVTDLGGMLSHAAIVSRELKIPCIVGTEHASRSLKNGDMIKIDLELGIVKKYEGEYDNGK